MKNLFARMSLSTASLAALAAALGMLVVVRLLSGTHSAELLATAAKVPNIPEMKLDAPALDAHLEPVRDHSLFYASRAFYIAPPPPAAPTAPPRPAYVLAGTFAIPHKHTVALLKQSAGTNVLKVKAGDDLEGWRVESVDAARVALGYHDERFEIVRTAREGASHVTRAPLMRGASGGLARIASTAGIAGASSATDAASNVATPATVATPPATVKSLGNGRSGTSGSGSTSHPDKPFIEARLYRRPSP
ncbi:MAG: hypothetical protein WDO68_16715 [Gammaproteobacteria bacterium]